MLVDWKGEKATPASLSHLSYRAPAPHVHPVNYFVSGYLQRAVNSCRADYTDRFIALVSQSNVCNVRVAATASLYFCLLHRPRFLAYSLPRQPLFLYPGPYNHPCEVCAVSRIFSCRRIKREREREIERCVGFGLFACKEDDDSVSKEHRDLRGEIT